MILRKGILSNNVFTLFKRGFINTWTYSHARYHGEEKLTRLDCFSNVHHIVTVSSASFF